VRFGKVGFDCKGALIAGFSFVWSSLALQYITRLCRSAQQLG
jgi:hypothetical protein